MTGGLKNARTFSRNTVPPNDKKAFSLFSCQGKTAIITGAGSGIGLSIAEALAEAGANVAIWYNSNKAAVDRAKAIEKDYGVKSKSYQVDVTKEDQVAKAVDIVVKEFNGRLDIFVANAGIFPSGTGLVDLDIASYQKCMAANLDSTVYCARAAGRYFKRQRDTLVDINGNRLENSFYGKFVATASISAGQYVDFPDLAASYAVAKAGVVQLCKSLAVEWIQFAQVNSVSPGTFATAMIDSLPEETKDIYRENCPMGRLGEPHELKGIYLYLCSNACSFTTGSNFTVDGGQSVV